MQQFHWKDCYASWDENGLRIGNSKFERLFPLIGHSLAAGELRSRDGYAWDSFTDEQMLFTGNVDEMTVIMEEDDRNGHSDKHLKVTLRFANAIYDFDRVLRIFPELSFMSTELYIRKFAGAAEQSNAKEEINTALEQTRKSDKTELCRPDAIDVVPIPSKHIKVEEILLRDCTDYNNWLVKRSEDSIYFGGQYRARGNVFLLQDYLAKKTLFVVREAPVTDCLSLANEGDLCQTGTYLQVCGTGFDGMPVSAPCMGYGVTIGLCDEGRETELYQQYFRAQTSGNRHNMGWMMSNTWGDRSRDAAVCHDFILQELEIAHQLGLDALQIDDGWEKGLTANSASANSNKWGVYYKDDPDFWTVNRNRFPMGLEPIVQRAKEYGIELGLWFSPDRSNDYANWRLDANNILSLHRRYGIRWFKLDGVCIESKTAETNYLRFLDAVRTESGNAVGFNQDITAEKRLGYFYESKYYGTLFVENRYTDWGRYFPHMTLRNLWDLSTIFPPERFQFELLNNRRNPQNYQDDPLAPQHYGIDYLFASVMVASPLFWMELSGLDESDRLRLRDVIAAYKAHRNAFANARIVPIGKRPDGTQHTGFQIQVNDREGYLVLLRECNEEPLCEYALADIDNKAEKDIRITAIHSNFDVPVEQTIHMDGKGVIRVNISKKFGYLFAKYKKC